MCSTYKQNILNFCYVRASFFGFSMIEINLSISYTSTRYNIKDVLRLTAGDTGVQIYKKLALTL